MTNKNKLSALLFSACMFTVGVGCTSESGLDEETAMEPQVEPVSEEAAAAVWWTCKGDATMQYDRPYNPIDRAQGFLVTGGGSTKAAAETSTKLVLQNKANAATRAGEKQRGWSYYSIYSCGKE